MITHHIRQSKYVEALRVLHRKGSDALEAPEKVSEFETWSRDTANLGILVAYE